MDAILLSMRPVLMYILGAMGIYTFSKAIYRFVRYGELPWSNLFPTYTCEELEDMTFSELSLISIAQLLKVASIIIMMPFIAAFAAFVIQDSMLWLNRELGLDLRFLADWYGPNMEILR